MVIDEAEHQVGQTDQIAVRQVTAVPGAQIGPVQRRRLVLRHHLEDVAGICALDTNVVGGDPVVANPQRVGVVPPDRQYGGPKWVLPVPLRIELPDERCAVRLCAQWS